jgi:cytochrome c-type protein NapB
MTQARRWGAAAFGLALLVASLPSATSARSFGPRRGPDKVERSDRRAFYTAPPTIPHSIKGFERLNKKCLSCHLKEKKLGRRRSMRTPHPELSNCLQCHIPNSGPLVLLPAQARALPKWAQGENKFLGLEEPKKGTRLFPRAPPTIPHRLFMRENCAGCHNKMNPNKVLRPPHPYRSNCRQCHLAQADQQF